VSTAPSQAELTRVQESLRRAIRGVCPEWLREQSDDLAQTAMLRIVAMFERGDKQPEELSSTYLWRTAHSVVMDEIRKKRRRREVADDGVVEATESPAPSPERVGSSAQIRGAIDEGLRQLSPGPRSAVLLFLHGLSLRETARTMGWNSKRAENMRYKGLSALRRFLDERGIVP